VVVARRYTFSDLLDLPDDHIYDIVGGALLVWNAPDGNHAELHTELFGFLFAAQTAGYGFVYSGTRAVALDFPLRGADAQDVTHPDLFFIREGREGILGARAVEGAPDLVIEILSHTTRHEHAPGGTLRDAYERNGVPHYWLADARTRTIRQYELIGEPYVGGRYGEPVTLRTGDLITSSLFPGLSVPLAQVFRRVRDHPHPARDRRL